MSGVFLNPAFYPTPSVATNRANVIHISPSGRIVSGNVSYSDETTVLPHVDLVSPRCGVFPTHPGVVPQSSLRVDYRSDYYAAIAELCDLQNKIEKAKNRLMYWAMVYKYVCRGYQLLQNALALAAVIVAFELFGFSPTTVRILTIVSFVASLSVWLSLGEVSRDMIHKSKELEQAEAVAREAEIMLADAIADDFIDSDERDKIREMIRRMYLAGENISFLSMFTKILSDTKISNTTRKFHQKLQGVMKRMVRKSVRIEEKEPLLVHEAKSQRLLSVL